MIMSNSCFFHLGRPFNDFAAIKLIPTYYFRYSPHQSRRSAKKRQATINSQTKASTSRNRLKLILATNA